MTCSGKNAFTERPIAIAFAEEIRSVTASATVPDRYLAPAWIDLQVNGFAGADYNDAAATPDEIGRSIRALHATGVARFFPTVITSAPGAMEAALRNLSRARAAIPEGAAIEGFHVEGPHIAPADGPRGAHPRAWVRPPNFGEFQRWQDATENRIRIVTLAPEWPEAPNYIERIVAAGAVASIGHTEATAAQIADAVSAGASLSTHLGNAAHSVLPRFNHIWEQLADDRLMAGFIVDGFHLPAAFLKVALRAKGADRAILVTDAAAPAGCQPGRYQLGEVAVDLTPDQRVVLGGGSRLAGSALRLDRAIANVMRTAGTPLGSAAGMATLNPARAVGISGRQRGLAPGDRADLVVFRVDPNTAALEVDETWLSGRLVYRASPDNE